MPVKRSRKAQGGRSLLGLSLATLTGTLVAAGIVASGCGARTPLDVGPPVVAPAVDLVDDQIVALQKRAHRIDPAPLRAMAHAQALPRRIGHIHQASLECGQDGTALPVACSNTAGLSKTKRDALPLCHRDETIHLSRIYSAHSTTTGNSP